MNKIIIPTSKSIDSLLNIGMEKEYDEMNIVDINNIEPKDDSITIINPYIHTKYNDIIHLKNKNTNVAQNILNNKTDEYKHFYTFVINSDLNDEILNEIDRIKEKNIRFEITYTIRVKNYKNIDKELSLIDKKGIRKKNIVFHLFKDDVDFIDSLTGGNKNILKTSLRKFLNNNDLKESLFQNTSMNFLINSNLFYPKNLDLSEYIEIYKETINEISKRLI